MAFDFINQAIDKVVGAGKAVKDVATTAVEDWKAGADSIKKSIAAPAKPKVDASVVQEIKNGGKLDNSLINALVDKAINLTIPKGVVNDVVSGSLRQPSKAEIKQKVDAGIPITEAIHQLKVSEPLANYTGKTIAPYTTAATDLGLINQGQANQILSDATGIAQFLGGNVANLAPLEGGVRKGTSEVKDVFTRENDTRSIKGKATDLLVGLSRPVVGGLQSYMSVTPAGIGATTAIGGVNKLTGFDKYQEQVIDNTAKKISEKTGASYEDAKNRVSGMIGGLSTVSGFKAGGAVSKIGSKQAAAESIVRNELKSSGVKATQKEITDLAKNIQDAVTPAQQLKSNIKEGLKATSWATAPQVVNDILTATTGTEGGDLVNQAKLHTAAGLSNIVGTKTGGSKKPKASSSIEPTPIIEVPTIKVTPKMAFAKPSVPGDSKAVYTSDDPNITQIIRSSFVSNKGQAKTAPEHTNALAEAGFSPEDITAIRDFAADNNTRGVIDAQKAKDFIIGLRNKQSTPTPTPTPTPAPTPTPIPTKAKASSSIEYEVPTIKATPAMAFGKPSVQGNSKAVYISDDPNITQIIRSSIISNNGTAKTAPEHTNALMEAGFSPEEVSLIRDFSVRVADKNGYINSEGMKNFLTSLKNRSIESTTPTPTKAKVAPTEKVITPTPEPSKVEATPPTPDVNQTLTSLVETYKGDGKTKGKVGSIQVDFENELNKALYSVRESKNKLKPKDESTLQELARLSGLDEAQIRKLGEDIATKIKDKIYREKAVTPEGVKISSSKDDGIIPKEDDILGLNEPPKEEVVSPLTQRYQELIANNAKEGDELSRAKGIFDFTPTGKIGNFFQKTFDKIAANIDRIASTKTFLNNFRVGGGKELAGNYVESKQARDNSQFNTANIDEFDIPSMVKRASSAPKRELKESDLVGATTPEGLVLDDTLAQKAYDTYRLDGDNVVDRATPLIAKGVSSKDIKQFIQNTYIYDIFKNNPEKLNEFFTPEQIAVFRKDDASSASIQSNIVKSSQDIGFFPKEIDTENGYLRKVTTARAAKEAGKMKGGDDGKIEVTLSDGTVIRADTMEEALRLSLLKRDSENFNPENMSSLTKKQAGPEYDPFRYHGYGASLLSLNDAMSKLYADKNAIKFIDGLIEKGDPNYTGAMKTKAYNLMAKDILGIRGTAKSEGSAETHLGTAANLGTKGAMLVNVGNATTNIVPSYLRTLMRSSMDLLTTAAARGIKEGWEGVKGAFKDAKLSQITKSMGDERVDARLRGLGLVNEYNIDNGSPYGKIEGQLMYMSNGTWAEIPGSKLAATLSMANSLNRAGRLEGAKDANDVIDRWEAWQKEGGQDFYEARGALDDQLRSLGKTGSTDKVNIPYVPASVNDILGKLKTWAVGQAMAQKEGINTVARSAIEKVFQKDRSYSNRQVEESIKDLGARYATYLATSAALGTIMQATGIFDENDDPEYKKLIIDEATRKIAPDPTVPYLWTLEQAVISDSAATSTILNGGKAAFQLLAAIKNQIEGDKKESDVYLRDALANLGKIGTVRNVSDIVGTFNKGDSLQDIVAKGADTFSKEEATRTGVASGKNWNSSLDRGLKLFGINGEQARLDALHRMKNNLAAPDWVKSVPFGGLMYQAIEREMRPVIDYFDDTKSSGGGGDLMENGVKAGYAYDVVKELHNAKNTTEFFNNLGIQEGQGLAKDLIDKLFKSNVDANIKVDPRLTDLVARVSPDNFPESMDKVREVDPYLYNNIVATLGEMKRVKDQNGSLSPEVINKVVQDKLSGANKSISQEDYAIAQANNDHAITTSFTNTLGQEIEKVQADLGNSKPEEARKKMDNLERLATVMNSPSLFTYKIPFGNLVANNVTNIQKAFSVLGGDPNSYPVLKDLLLFGAKVVRGATDAGQAKPPAPTSVTPTPLSGTTLRSMVRKPVIIDKPATVSNITIDKPLKVGQLKIDPLLVKLPTSQQGASLSNQTLSSMVKRKTPKL